MIYKYVIEINRGNVVRYVKMTEEFTDRISQAKSFTTAKWAKAYARRYGHTKYTIVQITVEE